MFIERAFFSDKSALSDWFSWFLSAWMFYGPNFFIRSYSFSIARLYRIPQNISPFLVPIIVVSLVYYVYAVDHKRRSK
jgi:hypothetical protein